MFDDTYLTIENRAEEVYKEKGSKFISLAFPVTTQEEIKEIVKDIKKEYFDARHHCYAYILGYNKSVFRLNDDGEPSSTAGKPIYGQLQSKNLTNILVVVVRYFGGTKLGVSGLIQAYKQATIDVLDNSKIIEKTVDEIYSVCFEYSLMNDVMKIMKEYDLHQQNHKFENDCYMEFRIRKRDSQKVIDSLKFIDNISVKFINEI